MKIAALDPDHVNEFNELATSYGTIFNTINWTKLFGERLKRYGFYDKEGQLKGGFVMYCQKKVGFRIYREPPFTPTIGPFMKLDAKNPAKIMSIRKKVLALMAAFIDSSSCHVVSFSLNIDITDTQPFIWRKYKVSPSYTYLVDLSRSIDELNRNMLAERRNDIKKGWKDGLLVRRVADLKSVRSLVLQTFERQSKGIDEYYLDKILSEFANEDNSFAFVTSKSNHPIACSFCIYDKYKAYYLLGGYSSHNKHHGAGSMATWESIKHAKQLGLRQFDFEGSMIPQVERYFRGFGGSITPYYRVSKATLPLEILLKFYKREWF